MKSYDKPTDNQVDDALPLLSSPQHEAYFFAQLENPHWITPLMIRGLFDHPPERETVKGGGVRFPMWPASQYLARMAVHAPDQVASIFAGLKTDNPSVIGDILDAALALPANVARALIPTISRASKMRILWLHFDDACELCILLANGGEVAAALILADALFTPKFAKDQEQLRRQDRYWYKAGLEKVLPVLVGRGPREFLPRLCGWLKVWIDVKEYADPRLGSDHSSIWRPAIEEHEENLDYDLAGSMVGFVRQGLEQAIREGNLSLEEALHMTSRYSYLVFGRIRVHLVKEFAEHNPTLARETVMDRSLFDDYEYKHEYAMLVRHRLDLLLSEEQAAWFGWIDAGPDLSDSNELIQESLGWHATSEDREKRKRYWQFEKLHWVQMHLVGKRREFYEDMLAKYGEPQLADLNINTSTRWGQESPMKVDDLTTLTFEQAVKQVASWMPSESQLIGANVEGLAETFGQYIATNPEGFSEQADALIGRPTIYVRAFISQMTEALKNGRTIDVSTVLRLCSWVLEQPLEVCPTSDQHNVLLIDKNRQWTRDEISHFVKKVCQAKDKDAPKYPLEGLRETIWRTVSTLCRDRSESYILHDISQDDPRVHDYLALGMNSPRGKAVEAVLEYARWIANSIKRTDGDQQIIPGGFEAMPEVRGMLEWQIAHNNRSFEPLAIIGAHIGLIYWIDSSWLAANARRLFHLEGVEESPPMAHGWAAWNAFLVWVRPHIEFYRLFEEQFAFAVAQSAQLNLAKQSGEQPMHHLGEHLMLLYGRGQLELEDEGLLARLLANSNPDIRRHAVGFVGQTLQGEEEIPEEVVNRFIDLWGMYWAGAGKGDVEEEPDAWVFGPWFASGKFPVPWALEQLENYLDVTPTPEPDDAIAEQLARIAGADIPRAVRILDRMVRGDREGWRIHGWLDSATLVLELAMKAGGAARVQAEQVINYLGRRGYLAFGELLNPRV